MASTYTAGETVDIGDVLEFNTTTGKVEQADATNDVVVGIALNAAVLDGQVAVEAVGLVKVVDCDSGVSKGEFLGPSAVVGEAAGSVSKTTNSFAIALTDASGGTCQAAFFTQIGAIAGIGDVFGPGSSTDNTLPRFNSTTGKLIQTSGVVVDDSDVITGHTQDANTIATGVLTHERGGLEADVSSFDGMSFISGGATTEVKYNRTATVAPTVTDDSDSNYAKGSIWIDTVSDLVYLCADASVGAANWHVIPEGTVGGEATGIAINTRKGSAGTISVGEVAYISGYNVGQDLPEVELADASSASTMPALGIAKEAITNSSNGEVIFSGRVSGVDTSAFSVGDDLFVSASTPGLLTTTQPTGTGLIQKVGEVLRSHATLGVIEVFGAGRSNALPNLAQNNIWVGDGSGVPAAVANLVHEAGGLEVDASAFAGLVRIDSGATTDVTNLAGLNTALGTSIIDGIQGRAAGLTGYWPLDEASGTRADFLGHNDLVDNNTVTQGAALGPEAASADFVPGNSEYLSLAGTAAKGPQGYGQFAFMCFFNVDDLSATRLIASKYDTGSNLRGWNVQIVTTGHIQFTTSYDGTNVVTVLSAAGRVVTGTDYFVAVTFDGQAIHMWTLKNGTDTNPIRDGSTRNTNLAANGLFVSTSVPLLIGAQKIAGVVSNFFDGTVASASTWNRSPEFPEIAHIANGGSGRKLDAIYDLL